MISSSWLYGIVSGIRLTAAAESSTPQSESVSNVRLSVATTERGGTVTVWVPLLSSTSMVVDSPDAAAEVSSVASEPQAVRPRASALRASP